MTAEEQKLLIRAVGMTNARHVSWYVTVNDGYIMIPFPWRNSASVIPDKKAGTPPRARMPQVFKNTIQQHYLTTKFNTKSQI